MALRSAEGLEERYYKKLRGPNCLHDSGICANKQVQQADMFSGFIIALHSIPDRVFVNLLGRAR